MLTQFGHVEWTSAQRRKASAVLRDRAARLRVRGIPYFKVIVPEKSIVYQEYLPSPLQNVTPAAKRPAEVLRDDNPNIVTYLQEYLLDAKSYGLLYFRGDTHTNFVGAWFEYLHIVGTLRTAGIVLEGEPRRMADLTPSIGAYGGDLFRQVAPVQREAMDMILGPTLPEDAMEIVTRLQIPPSKREANTVAVPEDYKHWFTTRETLVYERADGKGKRAVIFRDSTCDNVHDLLAQHFARSVFIWHGGRVYDEVITRENPDVVIHVMAERFVIYYDKFDALASIG